jgi:hypothetical protein
MQGGVQGFLAADELAQVRKQAAAEGMSPMTRAHVKPTAIPPHLKLVICPSPIYYKTLLFTKIKYYILTPNLTIGTRINPQLEMTRT